MSPRRIPKQIRERYLPRLVRIYRRDFHTCRYCGYRIASLTEATVDHVIPKSKGGSNYDHNLVLACGPCNSKKADRDPLEAGMPILPPDYPLPQN